MKNRYKNSDSDWAKQVPATRHEGPYEDYGWERGTSTLPEFRGPGVHLNPRERRQVMGETRRYGRREIPDHERDEYGWSQYYGEPYSRGYYGEQYYGEREERMSRERGEQDDWMDRERGEPEEWMRPGPYTGRGPRGYRRSDERVLEDVCQRLTRHGHIDARQINVEVRNGEVMLNGSVDSRRTRRMVEETVEDVPGVVDIRNDLTIRKEGE